MRQQSISVVVPTYNRAALLPRALESARAQTLPVAEIIVADDGSTDETMELLRELEKIEPRLVVVACAHGGANRARNAGVARASGDWIAFLDSDDSWTEDKMELQMAALAARPDAIASFTGMTMRGGGRERTFIPKPDPSLLDIRCCNTLSSTSTALVKAGTLRAVGGFDPELPSCQDWDLWFRLRRAGPFVVVQRSLVNIDAGPHQRITTDKPSVAEGHRIVFQRMLADVTSAFDRRRIRGSHMLVTSDIDRRAGRYREAARKAVAGCVLAPSRWAVRCILSSFSGVIRQRLSPRGQGAPISQSGG